VLGHSSIIASRTRQLEIPNRLRNGPAETSQNPSVRHWNPAPCRRAVQLLDPVFLPAFLPARTSCGRSHTLPSGPFNPTRSTLGGSLKAQWAKLRTIDTLNCGCTNVSARVTQLDARLPQPFTFPRAYFIQFFPRSRGLLRRDRDDWRIQAFADEQRCFESTSSLKSRVTHRQTAAPISRMMMRDAAVIKDLAAGSVTVSVAFSFRDPGAKRTKDCVTFPRSSRADAFRV